MADVEEEGDVCDVLVVVEYKLVVTCPRQYQPHQMRAPLVDTGSWESESEMEFLDTYALASPGQQIGTKFLLGSQVWTSASQEYVHAHLPGQSPTLSIKSCQWCI